MPELVKKLLQPHRSSRHKKKKKKKSAASATAPEHTEKPLTLSLSPDTMPASLLSHPGPDQDEDHFSNLEVFIKKYRKPCSSRNQKTKKCCKDSQFLLTATSKTMDGSPAPVTQLSNQDNDSLRWEGELQDPQEEAKRLELYRANRGKRYVAHREALSKETQHALRQTFLKKC